MKKTSLIILTAVLVFVLAACSKSASASVKKDEPKESTTLTTAQLDEEKTTETTQPLTEARKEQKTEKKTEKKSEKTTEKSRETEETEKTTKPSTTRPSTTKPPKKKTAAEIAEIYNSAVNKAVSSTAGFKKVINNTDVDADLGIFNQFKDTVFGFMRVGISEETQNKGQKIDRGGMQKASLTAADIKSFDYSEKDGKIILKISLKDGTTKSGSTAKAPVDKTGIFTGDKDWKEIDHKTAANFKYSIDNAKLGSIQIASVESVTEKTENAVVTAVINAKTGKPENIEISFHSTASLKNIKALGANISKDAGIGSVITYKDFKW